MQWLHNLIWVLIVVAVAALLGAGYVYDVRGNTKAAGVLFIVGLAMAWQAFRMRKWLRRMEHAKSE